MTTAILLFGLALVLALAEAFIPSMGVLSVLSAAAMISSIVLAFGVGTTEGLLTLLTAALAIPVTVAIGLRIFPRTPLGRRMVVGGLSFESTAATDERDLGLVGRAGTTLSDLRPAGHARIDGRRVDVVSRGERIEAGAAVRVLEVSGNRVVVVRDADGPSEAGAERASS